MSRRKGRRRGMIKSNAPKQSATNPGMVDVVIPVFNQFDLLEKCLDALPAAAGECKIRVWLVDDGSTHPLRQLKFPRLQSNGINVKYVTNAQNRGFPFSVNRGAEKGRSEFILVLNSDVVLADEAIEIMVEEFAFEKVGIVGAKMLFPLDCTDEHRPAGTIQHAGMVITFGGKPLHVHLGWPADHPRANKHREMQLVSGCCMMVRRSVWELVGGFAEVYGRGTFEDMELCVAARLRGFLVMYQPAAWGYHYAGASIDGEHNFPLAQNLMLWKYRCGDFVYWDEWRFW